VAASEAELAAAGQATEAVITEEGAGKGGEFETFCHCYHVW
jgi:hypothetical protein